MIWRLSSKVTVPKVPKISRSNAVERPMMPENPITRARAHLMEPVIVLPVFKLESKLARKRLNPLRLNESEILGLLKMVALLQKLLTRG